MTHAPAAQLEQLFVIDAADTLPEPPPAPTHEEVVAQVVAEEGASLPKPCRCEPPLIARDEYGGPWCWLCGRSPKVPV